MVEIKYRSKIARMLKGLPTGSYVAFDHVLLEHNGQFLGCGIVGSVAVHSEPSDIGHNYRIIHEDGKEVLLDLRSGLIVEREERKNYRAILLKTYNPEQGKPEEVKIQFMPDARCFYISKAN